MGDHALISGQAVVVGLARVTGRAIVRDQALVAGAAMLGDDAVVDGATRIIGGIVDTGPSDGGAVELPSPTDEVLPCSVGPQGMASAVK